jgi:hypothetical protein
MQEVNPVIAPLNKDSGPAKILKKKREKLFYVLSLLETLICILTCNDRLNREEPPFR